MKKTLIILAAICALSCCLAEAQGKKSVVGRAVERVLSPARGYDPDVIYQPVPRWTFALTGDLRQARFTQKQAFDLPSARSGPSGELVIEQIPVSVSSKLQGKIDKGIGIQAGYGDLSLALSKKFHGEGTDNVFSFDYLSAGYAFQVQFFDFSNPVNYHLNFAEEGHWAYRDEDDMTENPGRMRSFIMDAFYSFNQRTFAYSAAYKGNIFQRRSAGSLMFGSKVILGEYTIDPEEEIAAWTSGQSKQTSAQVSFGGGYSYNFVLFHRQPYAERDKGLRNLTINLTALPMVTIFNQFTSTAYHLEDGSYKETDKDVMNGKLLVNYVARIGVSYTYGLFTINLSASNDDFSYKGTSSLTYRGYKSNDVQTTGNFFRWMTALRVGMRF